MAADEIVQPRVRVVVGLGNPGARYEGTRHNVGFRVVEELLRRHQATWADEECRSRVASVPSEISAEMPDRGARDLLLVQPQTFMNRSGHALRCLRDRRELEAEDFLVVYDEVHLPLGTLRLRPKGSPAGHRGLESILESLGTDRVPRLRLGVGAVGGPPDGDDLVEYVLGDFEPSETDAVGAMITRAADAAEAWAGEGTAAAMQAFNGPPPSPEPAD